MRAHCGPARRSPGRPWAVRTVNGSLYSQPTTPFLDHQYLLDERLVHQRRTVGRGQVRSVAVPGPGEAFPDRFLQPLEPGAGRLQEPLDGHQHFAKPLLLPRWWPQHTRLYAP